MTFETVFTRHFWANVSCSDDYHFVEDFNLSEGILTFTN